VTLRVGYDRTSDGRDAADVDEGLSCCGSILLKQRYRGKCADERPYDAKL